MVDHPYQFSKNNLEHSDKILTKDVTKISSSKKHLKININRCTTPQLSNPEHLLQELKQQLTNTKLASSFLRYSDLDLSYSSSVNRFAYNDANHESNKMLSETVNKTFSIEVTQTSTPIAIKSQNLGQNKNFNLLFQEIENKPIISENFLENNPEIRQSSLDNFFSKNKKVNKIKNLVPEKTGKQDLIEENEEVFQNNKRFPKAEPSKNNTSPAPFLNSKMKLSEQKSPKKVNFFHSHRFSIKKTCSHKQSPDQLISPKSERILVNKFKRDFFSIVSESQSEISYYNYANILRKLKMVLDKDIENERALMISLWNLISSKGKAETSELLSYLTAIMRLSPLPKKKLKFSKEDSEKLHTKYFIFFSNRQASVNKSPANPSITPRSEFSFKPEINENSKNLMSNVSDNSSRGELHKKSRPSLKTEKTREQVLKLIEKECTFRPVINSLSQEYQRNNDSGQSPQVERTQALYNNFFVLKAKRQEMEEIKIAKSQKEFEDCSFSPKINRKITKETGEDLKDGEGVSKISANVKGKDVQQKIGYKGFTNQSDLNTREKMQGLGDKESRLEAKSRTKNKEKIAEIIKKKLAFASNFQLEKGSNVYKHLKN